MKHPEIKIQIPEPCHEDWNKMTPTEKGRFCGVCTKEVIDFTAKSDEELIRHVINDENLCGRFHPSQLNRKLIADRKKQNHWLSYAATLLLPMTVFAQVEPRMIEKPDVIEKVDASNFKSLHIGSQHKKGKINPHIKKDSISIKGVVTDDTGLPFHSVTITVKGAKTGILTDFDGNFSIRTISGSILVITYPGYKTQEIKAINTKNTYTIQMESEDVYTEVTGMGRYVNLQGVTGLPTTVNAEDVKYIGDKKKSFFQSLQELWMRKTQNPKKKH